jgi:peptidoglycan L-alanyl-D-glutamate endopeptidase CwlK
MIAKLSLKSLARLDGVHPDLVRVVERAIALTKVDFAVAEGVRTPERQAVLVSQGFSKTLNSKHLIQRDGYGWAVDVVAVGDLDRDGHIDAQDTKHTWDRALYEDIARAFDAASIELGVSIRWGGRFKSFFDGPHFELVA